MEFVVRFLALIVVLFPVCAAAGDKVHREGLLIEGPVRAEDSWVGEGTPTGVKAKNWVYVVKVGDYAYTGYADRVGGIFAAKGPQQEDWPADSTIQVVFHTRMGSLYMDLKSPTGKKKRISGFSPRGVRTARNCAARSSARSRRKILKTRFRPGAAESRGMPYQSTIRTRSSWRNTR